jgi:ribosomal protein L11 methylase PrmA
LGKILTNESLLLISGILIKDEQSISEIFNEVGILKQLVLCKEEWISILFKKQ